MLLELNLTGDAVMPKLTRELLIARVFSDPKNYPYGFSRSGDFSIGESKALSQYGCLISALVGGQLEPSNTQEEGILATAFGRKEPEAPYEKAWVKYQGRINRLKPANIYRSGLAPATGNDDDDRADIGEDSGFKIQVDDI
ncbi:MAG: hypothetical protein ACI965_001155 [Paraglaciecola sp.]